MEERLVIINNIKKLIQKRGYIYTLCTILAEDYFVEMEKLHEVNHYERLNENEIGLLLGFMIQNEIKLDYPKTPEHLLEMKYETRILLEDLHKTFGVGDLKDFIEKSKNPNFNFKEYNKEFWTSEGRMLEPIFYDGTGVYDFEYLDYTKSKYMKDKDWLIKNYNFDPDTIKTLIDELKKYIHLKANKRRFIQYDDCLKEIIKQNKKILTKENRYEENVQMQLEKYAKEFELSLYQYLIESNDINNYYDDLLNAFILKKSDFGIQIQLLIESFSTVANSDNNLEFQSIGDFNLINSNPIVKLSDENFFIPVMFTLCQAVYESPFYWMIKNEDYKPIALKNRGDIGENLVYDILQKVFSNQFTFKSVKISWNKSKTKTDIDVLCFLGNKALCVQVKSKKLTQLSKQGSLEQLYIDFKGAIQSAYSQGLESRESILFKDAKFLDERGNVINIPEEIDECYILCVTTENYPALTHQTQILLNKTPESPYPLVVSIFDLQLMAHYLNDPYDFLYYVRQRILLPDFFIAKSEADYLGFHLQNKLSKIPGYSACTIEGCANMIDRNYYPKMAGINVTDKGDQIKKIWRNEDFEKFCNEIKTQNIPKFTDIIFHLYDLGKESQNDITKFILRTKNATLRDGKPHDFRLHPTEEIKTGFTYLSYPGNNIFEMKNMLTFLCDKRKYLCKADYWLGFGSIGESRNMIDLLIYNEKPWQYDKELEKISKLGGEGQIQNLKKIGRNDPCPCGNRNSDGSRKKYKLCCWNK
jgi:hypothetical protein